MKSVSLCEKTVMMCLNLSLSPSTFTHCKRMNCTMYQKKNSLLYCVSESGSGSGSDSEQERPRSASNASGSGSDSDRERDDDDEEEGQDAGKPSMNKVSVCVWLVTPSTHSGFRSCSARVNSQTCSASKPNPYPIITYLIDNVSFLS